MKYIKNGYIMMMALYSIIVHVVIPSDTLTGQGQYFFVEGATGVGKTTFVELLKKNVPDIAIVYEPLESFINVHGVGNILELFFKDPQRWAFTTNIYITLMHAQAAENCIDIPILTVIDRSMYADCYVYGKMACAVGNITLLEWAVYKNFFTWILKHSNIKPSGFIYLQAPAEMVIKRVQKRDRMEEKDLPLQYQLDQERYYNEWFIEKKDLSEDLAEVPVLVIDATRNFKDDLIIQQECLNEVRTFFKEQLEHWD